MTHRDVETRGKLPMKPSETSSSDVPGRYVPTMHFAHKTRAGAAALLGILALLSCTALFLKLNPDFQQQVKSVEEFEHMDAGAQAAARKVHGGRFGEPTPLMLIYQTAPLAGIPLGMGALLLGMSARRVTPGFSLSPRDRRRSIFAIFAGGITAVAYSLALLVPLFE